MECSKAACLVSIIHQVLANIFGVSLLHSLRAALYPGKGYEKPTFDGFFLGSTPRAHPELSLRRDTLAEMRTEPNAHLGMKT